MRFRRKNFLGGKIPLMYELLECLGLRQMANNNLSCNKTYFMFIDSTKSEQVGQY